jgi:hypothetical protein
MKNIHVLPTSKPSRLQLQMNGKYHLENGQIIALKSFHNIYITNDSEIKEGDWFYDLDTKYVKIKQSWENSHLDFNGKKIILTTDKDLIKDGVQAIDDEFLEWFVKNPSCERVEIEDFPMTEKYNSKGEYVHRSYWVYKIIIPKEEPKQETLEQAAEIILANNIDGLRDALKDDDLFYFYKGVIQCYGETMANWQQEQDKNKYSEEDLREAFRQGQDNMDYSDTYGRDSKLTEQEWFEQFKNK